MPIAIRELVIKATIKDASQRNRTSAEKPSKKQGAIIEESSENTLEIIKRKKKDNVRRKT
jgi:hypothetical protein